MKCENLYENILLLADISKTLVNKRKRLEQYTQNSLKTTNRKMEDIWKQQRGDRSAHKDVKDIQDQLKYIPDLATAHVIT